MGHITFCRVYHFKIGTHVRGTLVRYSTCKTEALEHNYLGYVEVVNNGVREVVVFKWSTKVSLLAKGLTYYVNLEL